MTPEHREFLALYNASGWSQTELARQLFTTQATVSRYLSGAVPVPASAVRLLKLTLASENPAALNAVEKPKTSHASHTDEVQEMAEKMGDIKRADPQAYKAAKLVIDSMHEQATKEAPSPPPLKRVAPADLKREMVKAHPLRSEVSERNTRAASTTGSKSARRPPVSKRPSTPQPAPAPVPTSHES